MKEIKFRAWLKNEHKMVDVAEISWIYRSIEYLHKNSHTYYEALFDEIELMQYIGLKDKNGTEIYEGDILKVNDGSINGEVMSYNMAVKFVIDKELNFPSFTAPSWAYLNPNWSHNMKVIGNIYENAELLEVQDEN